MTQHKQKLRLLESFGTDATAGLGTEEPPPGQQPKLMPASLGQQFLGALAPEKGAHFSTNPGARKNANANWTSNPTVHDQFLEANCEPGLEIRAKHY